MGTETIDIPIKMLEEICDAHEIIDRILETLEVLLDEETLARLKKGEEELRTGEYGDTELDEIEELLK